MSAKEFLEPDARKRVAEAIAAVEQQTAAEVVVAVRKTSGHYRHTDYLLGSLCALVGLLVFLFHPAPFEEDLFPVAELALFLTGVALSVAISPLRRLLTSGSLRSSNVATAGRAAFYELGIGRTRQRTGILVYVSLFEREALVLADSGVEPEKLGEGWSEAVRMIEASVREGGMAQLLAGLGRLGAPLGKALPRAADDVNELPDEVR